MSDCEEDDFEISQFGNDDLILNQSENQRKWLDSYIAASPYSKSLYSYSQKPNLSLQYKIEKLTDKLKTNDLHDLIRTLKGKFGKRLLKQPQSKIKFNQKSQSIQEEGRHQTTIKAIISYPTFPLPKFNNVQEKQHYYCKKLIASHLIGKEYVFEELQQKISQSQFKQYIHQKDIKTILEEIGIESYRNAEKFINIQLRKKTISLSKQDELSLLSVLKNCRQNLFQAVCTTYYKFIQMTYNLCEVVSLSNKQVMNFYNALQQWIFAFRVANRNPELSKKLAINGTSNNYRVDCISKSVVSVGSSIVRTKADKVILKQRQYDKQERQQFRAFINQRKIEVDMLCQYKLNPTISHITAYIKHKYPEKQELIILVEVKTKFHMILRAAYRRLVQLWQMLDCITKMPRLITLNNSNIEHVLVSPQALKVRIGLINVWLLEQGDSNEYMKSVVSPAVIQISDYMYGRQYPQLKHLKSQKNVFNRQQSFQTKGRQKSKFQRGINRAMLNQKSIEK